MSVKPPDPANTPLPPEPDPPGSAASLPKDRLPKPYLGSQGDENRDPPPNAPAPVAPAETVQDKDPPR